MWRSSPAPLSRFMRVHRLGRSFCAWPIPTLLAPHLLTSENLSLSIRDTSDPEHPVSKLRGWVSRKGYCAGPRKTCLPSWKQGPPAAQQQSSGHPELYGPPCLGLEEGEELACTGWAKLQRGGFPALGLSSFLLSSSLLGLASSEAGWDPFPAGPGRHAFQAFPC